MSRVIDAALIGQKTPKMTFKYPGNGFKICRNICQLGGFRETEGSD